MPNRPAPPVRTRADVEREVRGVFYIDEDSADGEKQLVSRVSAALLATAECGCWKCRNECINCGHPPHTTTCQGHGNHYVPGHGFESCDCTTDATTQPDGCHGTGLNQSRLARSLDALEGQG